MIRFTDMEAAGYVPTFLDLLDERSAVEQINANYAHGGGWHKFEGFTLHGLFGKESRFRIDHIQSNEIDLTDLSGIYLEYPGDPNVMARTAGVLRDELILMFDHAWVAVVQSDGSYEIARID